MIKQIKKINPKKIVYPLILMAYFGVIALLLFFSINFFTRELNLILATGEDMAGGQNQLELDLAGYSLLEKKFKLAPMVATSVPIIVEAPTLATSTASSTPELPATSTPPLIEDASTTPLTISVLNSTRTAGLAGKLKKILEVAGWPVANIGNSSPVLATTAINLSPTAADHPDLPEIKSILTASGLEYTENQLDQTGSYDLEIIIGLPR